MRRRLGSRALVATAGMVLLAIGPELEAYGAGAQPVSLAGRYEKLMQTLDIYAPPPDAKTIMTIGELYARVADQGYSIKLARQDLSSGLLSYETYKSTLRPQLALQAGTNNSLSSQPDPGGLYEDRTTTKTNNVGLVLTGQPIEGVTYNLNLPTYTQNTTATEPVFAGSGGSSTSDSTLLGGTVVLSLLKGSAFVQKHIPDMQAEIARSSSRESFKQATIQAIAAAETAFYDVIAKQLRVRINERSLESAHALRDDLAEMVKAGEADQLSILKVDLQIAQAEVDLLSARSDYVTSRETLRNLLALSKEEGLTLYPDARAIDAVPPRAVLSLEQLLDKAKRDRPDYRSAKLASQSASLTKEIASTQRLPQLDFNVGYNATGQATGFRSASQGAVNQNQRQASYGLTFNYILYNNIEDPSYRQAIISNERAKFSVDDLANQMSRDLSGLIDRLDLGYRRLNISILTRQLSEKKLAAEYEKFRVGESSIRNIIDYQADLNAARIGELSAKSDLVLGLAQLRAATGELPAGVSYRF